MTGDEPRNVSEQFAAQLRRFRPWAILLVVLIVSFLASPLVMVALDVDLHYFLYTGVALVIVLVPLTVLAIRASRCPACNRYMGRDIGKHCPLCGAILRR